ncbi:sialic acid-binding Ig-like lectin 10, partial [Rhinoraja longicauda]
YPFLCVLDFADKPTIFPAKMVAGQPVNVTCSFNTKCNGTTPNLTWVTPADIPSSASHSKTQRGDTLTYTSVLSLTPALKHDGQDLTCKVRYPTVSSKQKLTLTVQYAPQNLSITSPNNMNSSGVSVKEGNSAAFHCSVQSLPASNLTWRHLGVTLNTTRSSNELWMEFPQLAPRDAGVYQCVAQNEHGTTERDVTLTVEYAPQNLSITSPSNVNNSGVSVKEGNSAAFLCSVQSFPVSNLTWRHLGVTLNTTRSSNELWMEFPQLALRDAGVYQCVAQNEHGTRERDVTLTVEYAPQNLSITSPSNVNNSGVSVKEGNSAAFLCSVQSFPASNLTWRHLGVTLNTTRSSNELWMEFPQLALRDAGVYQCVAQNEHGTRERDVTLTVEYAPQNISITSPSNVNNSGVSVKEGNSAAILCSVQSFPASNLTWRHHGVTLSTTRSSNELWLKILRVTQRDAGSYQCVAENEYGKEEGTVTLVVEYGPVILPDSGCSRTPESVTCVCAAWCNPPGELTWRLPQANFSGNQTFGHFQTWQVAGGHLVNSTLTLRGREGVDVTALCTVRSRHGEAMLMVYLSMEICGCDRTGKYVMAVIVLAVVITAAIFWAARCRGKRESSVAQPKEQKVEDGPVESPYQELLLGERDLYSDLNLRHK